MMKLFMIAKSNIKKNKSMTIALAILITFASILLYIGASVVLNMNSFLDKKNKELNGSDFTVLAPLKYDAVIHKILKDTGKYVQHETKEALVAPSTFKNMSLNEESQSIGIVLLNADSQEKISQLKILQKGSKIEPNSIILPYYLQVAKGYKTGDEISIIFGGKKHSFLIYGFAEDVMFSIPSNMPIYKCYVFGDLFRKLYSESEVTQYSLLKTKLSKETDVAQYENIFIKQLNNNIKGSTDSITALNYPTNKLGAGIFMIIIMSVLIIFSIIIIIIALTVMRFAIVTHIEGNMKNIGSMEAMGFTGKELILSTVLQFGLIGLTSTVIGILIAIACSSIVSHLASTSVGLMWKSNIDLSAMVIDLVVVMLLIIIIAYFNSAKLKKITPIIALRNGIDTHNFKKNHFPFSKGSIGVNLTIGLKNLMQNMKQNVTILVITILMSFATIFAFTANYNFNVDNKALLRLVGLEKSQLSISYEGKDTKERFNKIAVMPHVKKTIRLSTISMTASMGEREAVLTLSVCNDFDSLEIKTIVNGRYPIHDNEIAVTGRILKELRAKIGDVISLSSNEANQEFIIVGETQQISHLGKGAGITEEGMKRISAYFNPNQLYIYLDSSENIDMVKKSIEKEFDGLSFGLNNVEKTFDTILNSFNSAMAGLSIACIIITLGIISLILYLLIKIKMIKERQRIGVLKAIGFTTKQIVMHFIIGFCPVCILGILLGAILAIYLINPFFSVMLSVSGIKNSSMTINPLLLLVTFCSISVFSVFVTAFVARGVKKITPRELFL